MYGIISNEITLDAHRLYTKKEAANYIGYKSTTVLKNLPIKPVRLSLVGIGKGERYDRRALDAYLDGLSNLTTKPVPLSEADQAAAELEEWILTRAS